MNSIGQTVFELQSGNKKCVRTDGRTDVGHINLIGGLVTRNPPKKQPSFGLVPSEDQLLFFDITLMDIKGGYLNPPDTPSLFLKYRT